METYHLIKKKNSESIKLLYERYGKKLYSYAIVSWKVSEDESWETVYKTLYKVMEVSPRYIFESEEKFSSFLFKIFINYLRNQYRDKKRSDFPEWEELRVNHVTEVAPLESFENKLNPDKKLSLLQEELEKLEDWQKILLLMRAQDFSYSTIATYAGKPEGQLKVYYLRLKRMIMERIDKRLTKTEDNANV